MFVFIKKVLLIGSLFLSSLVSTAALSCISMNNQACKVRPKIAMSLYFMLLVLKKVNVVVAVAILTIGMQKYVFLML